MTYDSRSFIKSTVNSSLLYWTSALSVQVVITLSACLHQSNVLYRNFIGAVLSIFANLLLGWAVNEQVRFILTSVLQKNSEIFPAEQLKFLSVITCSLSKASKTFHFRVLVSLDQLRIVVERKCVKKFNLISAAFTFLF